MRQSVFNTVGGVARMAVQVITVPFLVRQLGLESFGLWNLITATIATLGVIEGGLAISTTYFSSRAIGENDDRALAETLSVTGTLLFLIGLLGALIMWIGSVWVADRVIKVDAADRETVVTALKWSSVVVFVRLVQQVPVSVLQAFQKYGIYNSLLLCHTILTSGLLLVVAISGGELHELMLVEVVMSVSFLAVFVVIATGILRQRITRFAWRWERCREIIRHSLLTWGSTLGSMMFSSGDRLIVGHILGPGAAGIYVIIVNIAARINQISALSVQPLMPAVSCGVLKNIREGNGHVAKIAFAYRACGSIALSLVMVMISLEGWVVRLFIGQSVDQTTLEVFRAAVVIYGIYSLNAPGFYLMLGAGRVGTSMAIILTSGGISLLTILIGAHWFGLYGAIIGNATYILTLVFNLIAAKLFAINPLCWVRWILVPTIWCFACVALNSLTSNLFLKCLFVCIEVGGLLVWHVWPQRRCALRIMRDSRDLLLKSFLAIIGKGR